jgi:protein gp37
LLSSINITRTTTLDPRGMRAVAVACKDKTFFLKHVGGHPDKRGKDKALLDGRLWHELPPIAESVPA